MAIMIPEKPRTFKLKSREDIMFDALAKLPDDYYVVHSFQETKIKDGNRIIDAEADFVVFNRTKGLMCIEAKASVGGYENGKWYYISGEEMSHDGPFAQARMMMYDIQDRMKALGMLSAIEHCKFYHAVWFPTASAAQIRRLPLPMEALRELILTEEALIDPEPYLERIFSLAEKRKTATDLTEAQASRIVNEILCPQFEIAPSASFDTDTKHMLFHRLLKEQASVLNFLEEQKTAVINGAAGTGKTLVAVEKAKRHAFRGEKVLFLCFNRRLRDHLAENYAHEYIDFMTISGLACRFGRTPAPDYALLNRILEKMWEDGSFPYAHVVVDEGQDFGIKAIEEADILLTLKTIIEDTKENGSFYVFYDKLQLNQARKLPRYLADADCKLTLYRNCRNTENIAKTSLRPITERSPKLMENCIAGVPAKLHFCPDGDSVLAAVDNTIDELRGEGIDNIVILTCIKEADSVLAPYLEEGMYPAGRKKLIFTTCRKFKGLEADAVILVDVDENTFLGKDDSEQNVYNYYVGTSRARLRLDIMTTMDNERCIRVLEKLGKGEKIKNPQRELAKALNTLRVMESGE